MISEEQYKKAQKTVKQYEFEQLELLRIKNNNCRLGRFPKDCSIILNTSFKECFDCGHYKNQ